jgi:hypothetical protein
MLMSALSAPLYAKALIDSALRRKSKFVVTPKGDSASPDRWFGTFRYHWYFIGIFGASIVAGFVFGHSHPAMIIWASFATLITATPIFVWRHMLREEKKKRPARHRGGQPSQPAPAPAVDHAPQAKPSWGEQNDTMQIALEGHKK